mmetsp:Transcript_17903/g.56156  ORF Transcript_17903/g.56156 Transcript_17903/m.56156 type:complete len:797 (-) Transcript_17903:124-2514(-)
MAKKAKRVDRTDKWYVLAKEQGYRSRAAFKLAQINAEFGVLSSSGRGGAVLDLCAAPGGWSQVAAKAVGESRAVVAVDLLPIRALSGVSTIVGDITSKGTQDAVRREVVRRTGGAQVEVALCDGAPNVGAEYGRDAFAQNEISLAALKCAVECGLEAGGAFVTKVYRGRDYNALVWAFGRLFERVRAFKPAASRSQSAEIFVVCQNYLAPTKVDPKLLDPKTVFGAEDASHKLSVLHPKYGERRRQREGYGDELLRARRATAAEFAAAKDPAQFLAEHDAVDFDDEAPDEVRACAADLRLLNRADMRALLRYREKKLVKQAVEPPEAEAEAASEAESVDSEEAVQREILAERGAMAAEARRAKKRERRSEAKRRARAAAGLTEESAVELGDAEVFAFSQGLEMGDRGLQEEAAAAAPPEKEEEEAVLEAQLDEAYEAYAARRRDAPELGKLVAKRKRDAQAAERVADEVAMAEGDVEAYVEQLGVADDDEDEVDPGAAERWFSKPIFADLPEMPKTEKQVRHEKRKRALERQDRKKQRRDGPGVEVVEASEARPEEAKSLIKAGLGALLSPGEAETKLEVVQAAPLRRFDVDDDDDDDDKAERMALATSMLRRSKAKALVDASYNRYAWHDPADLPAWFVADEKLHYRPQLPLKPELVDEMKRKFQNLAAKPIKKVVEARARKQARATAKLKAAKRKAAALAENPDMTPNQKLRAVQKAMAKGAKLDKPSKVYVVQRKTKNGAISKHAGGKSPAAKNARVKLVDRRLKKDKRAAKASATRSSKGSTKKNAKKRRRR